MIVDTSALMSILKDEPTSQQCIAVIDQGTAKKISAANLLELFIVVDRNGNTMLNRVMDDLLQSAEIRVEPVTEKQVWIARDAYRDFGKGSGHPAKLNFGDCLAYALARDKREPAVCGQRFHAH